MSRLTVSPTVSPTVISLVSLVSLGLLTACEVDELEPELRESAEAPGTEKANKVDICHITGNGSYHVINVSTSAQSAHLAHGDHLAGTFYLDADGDGQGDPGITSDCMDPGYVDNGDDCDDSDDTTYDGAEEICDDGVDNDCDGEIDEDCTVEVEIHVAGDNGVWVWLDGEAVALSYTSPDWSVARSATLELDTGDTHALAFYVEDWGGLAYFAASVRVDGQVVAATGDGDFTGTGGISSSSINEWPRISAWANTPEQASDWPNLIFSPGTTWGDWMQPGFDDSAWDLDTNTCSSPSYWNTAWFDTYYTDFDALYDDGAEFVWYDFGYYSAGTCYSSGDSATAWRLELSL